MSRGFKSGLLAITRNTVRVRRTCPAPSSRVLKSDRTSIMSPAWDFPEVAGPVEPETFENHPVVYSQHGTKRTLPLASLSHLDEKGEAILTLPLLKFNSSNCRNVSILVEEKCCRLRCLPEDKLYPGCLIRLHRYNASWPDQHLRSLQHRALW
jgi:hypothetical protein